MTAIVAACYRGGILIGAESRCASFDKKFGDIVNDDAQKLVSLRLRKTVFGAAGEFDIGTTYVPTNEYIPVLSFPGLLTFKLMHSSEVSADVLRHCMQEFVDLSRFIGEVQPRSLDVTFGITFPQGPRIYRIRVKSHPWQKLLDCENTVCLGSGIWEHYVADVENRKNFFVHDDAQRLQKLKTDGLVTPSMPVAAFETRDQAQNWVRSVIEWCCVAFPVFCGGPINFADTDTDQIKFDPRPRSNKNSQSLTTVSA